MDNILTVEDLAVSYGNKTVIENISFSVQKGDFLVIFGENGSGKSSLLNALLGLIQPSEGKITFSRNCPRSEIGYLPQLTSQQNNFPASAWEVVISGCLNKMGLRPFYGKKEKAIVAENMKLLNVFDLKGECFRNLSGGQKQRVLLSRALCSAGKILFLDEPVSGLDPHATKEFYDAVKKINDRGVCIVMVSHDTDSALALATHVLDIGNHTSFFGTREQYSQKGNF